MEKLNADVVIVGAGLAGHCAALEAAATGADVLLLEKQPTVGGSTVLSGGSFAFAGTDLQKAIGVEDSSELLERDLREIGGHKNDPKLVHLYGEKQLDSYHWLRKQGVEFGPIQISSGQSVPRLHPTNPRRVIEQLNAHVAGKSNIRVLCDTPTKRLVRDGEAGRVVAVEAETGGKRVTVTARNGVVLTSGGFARNNDLIDMFVPEQLKASRIGGPGNVGDGLMMAWRLGAGFRDMGFIKGSFGSHPSAGSEMHTAMLAVYKGAIAVNSSGRRFVDEGLSYKTLGDAVLRQEGGTGYQIFDQTIMDQSVDGVPIFDFRRREREGLMIKADSLEELARKIDVPADALLRTVAAYNKAVAEGQGDEVGRRGLSLNYGKLTPIERAPFYAYHSTSAIIATYCGLTIDTETRVLDVEGNAIGRLFAAGEITGGFHGNAYMTGSSLGKSTICGRIAGRNAAQGL